MIYSQFVLILGILGGYGEIENPRGGNRQGEKP